MSTRTKKPDVNVGTQTDEQKAEAKARAEAPQAGSTVEKRKDGTFRVTKVGDSEIAVRIG